MPAANDRRSRLGAPLATVLATLLATLTGIGMLVVLTAHAIPILSEAMFS